MPNQQIPQQVAGGKSDGSEEVPNRQIPQKVAGDKPDDALNLQANGEVTSELQGRANAARLEGLVDSAAIGTLNHLSQKARVPLSFCKSPLPAVNPHIPHAGWTIEVTWNGEVSALSDTATLRVPRAPSHPPSRTPTPAPASTH